MCVCPFAQGEKELFFFFVCYCQRTRKLTFKPFWFDKRLLIILITKHGSRVVFNQQVTKKLLRRNERTRSFDVSFSSRCDASTAQWARRRRSDEIRESLELQRTERRSIDFRIDLFGGSFSMLSNDDALSSRSGISHFQRCALQIFLSLQSPCAVQQTFFSSSSQTLENKTCEWNCRWNDARSLCARALDCYIGAARIRVRGLSNFTVITAFEYEFQFCLFL